MARVKMTDQDKAWQAQDDVRTLKNAEEIRKNRSRLSAANAEAKKQMEALKKIAKPKPARPRPVPRARAAKKSR